MEKLVKQKTSNYPIIPFNFHSSQGGGCMAIAAFLVSGTATLPSKYDNADQRLANDRTEWVRLGEAIALFGAK